MKYSPNNHPDMEEEAMHLVNIRDYKGYFQSLIDYPTANGTEYRWCFYLAWFTSDDKGAHIMKWDRSYEIIPITEDGCIMIDGKAYGDRYWDH